MGEVEPTMLGDVERSLRVGRTAAATAQVTRALESMEDCASPERGEALHLLGLAKRQCGDLEEALDAHTKAEYVFGALGDGRAEARERCAIGRLHLDQGHLREAHRAFVAVVGASGAGAELPQILVAQAGLVEVRARRGDAAEAADTLAAGIALARNDGITDAEAACHAANAVVEGLLGDPGRSDAAYEAAVRLLRHGGHHATAALHATMAEHRAARGDVTGAREALRAADAVVGTDRDGHVAALVALARGAIAESAGDLTTALTGYWQAADLARRGGSAGLEHAAGLLSGQLDPDQGRAFAYMRRALLALALEGDRTALLLRPSLAVWLRERLDVLAVPADALSGVTDLLTIRAPVDGTAAAAGGLQVTMLGGLDVRIAGRRISDRAWRTSKAKELFALLLLHRERALPRDEVIERLWPESDPGSGISNFHFTLHALRKALASTRSESAPTVATEGGYQLRTDQRSPLDIDVFALLLHEANRFRRVGRSEDAVRLFRAATAMYRGDLLAELDGEWVAERREDIVRQYLSALRQTAELELEREDATAAAAACRAYLAREGYDEHVHRLLLRAYRASGDAALVERHYRGLADLLRSELGTSPERETTQLYERLRGSGGRIGPLAPVRLPTR